MSDAGPVIREAQAADVQAVASYLAPRMGGSGGPERYRRFLQCDWISDKPNIGVLIEDGRQIGGFLGAIYARRRVGAADHLFCNINSWHVEERFRRLSLQMMARLLARQDCTFTCFSPSVRVVELLKFFQFRQLDSGKVVFSPLVGLADLWRRPWPRVFWGAALEARLTDDEQRIRRDHRSYRCGHFLIERGARRSYFVTVRRGRGIRAFADVLHASDTGLLADSIAHVQAPIGLTHRTFLVGVDRRLLRSSPAGTFVYRGLRPLMFRSKGVGPEAIDTLYSELVPMYG